MVARASSAINLQRCRLDTTQLIVIVIILVIVRIVLLIVIVIVISN